MSDELEIQDARANFQRFQAPGAPENSAPQLALVTAGDGAQIPVRVYGKENQSTPIILSHGLQSHSGWFTNSCSFLASQGFPVYAYDRRGSGLSAETRGDCDDFQTMIADIHTVAQRAMSTHDATQVHVFGHCFGVMPATAFACTHPTITRSLTLATPGIFTKDDLSKAAKWQIVRSQLFKKTARLPAPLAPEIFSERPDYIDFIRHDPLMLRSMTTRLYWQVLRMRRFISKSVKNLTMPVFMGLAGRDTICDNARNRAFFGKLPSARKFLIEYPDTRHVLEFGPQKREAFSDLQWWHAQFPFSE